MNLVKQKAPLVQKTRAFALKKAYSVDQKLTPLERYTI